MDTPLRVSDYFDRVYLKAERFWWRGPERYSSDPNQYPTSLLTQHTLRLLADRKPGRALDLGAGEGADTIRLAKLGYEVDAVEISTVGAKKIEHFAEQADVDAKVRVIAGDIQDFTPDVQYDVVICNGVLHYVMDKKRAIDLMQEATLRSGFNVISLWSSYTPVPEYHEIVDLYADDEEGVVTSAYSKWHKELIYFERDKPELAHFDMPPHRHSHIKLIARKV